jgi:hypothetical protein
MRPTSSSRPVSSSRKESTRSTSTQSMQESEQPLCSQIWNLWHLTSTIFQAQLPVVQLKQRQPKGVPFLMPPLSSHSIFLACGSCHFKSTLPILIRGSFYTQPPLLTSIAEALFDMMIPLRHRSWVLRCPSEPTFAHHDRHHRPSLNPSSLSFCHGALTSYCMAMAGFATDISPLHTLKISY